MCMLGGHDSEVARILTLRTLELGEMEAMVEDTSLINKYPVFNFKWKKWVFTFWFVNLA